MNTVPSHNAGFLAWRSSHQDRVEQSLSRWVSEDAPASLGEVMRYAVLGGGKRLRPLLVLATAEAVGGNEAAAMRAACAVELIHAYSLVHDDMPCMDNDVLRRGKPTVHVKFGEAQALLAGDALQALAFELLVPMDGTVPASVAVQLCGQLARAAGASGMAGGQAVDQLLTCMRVYAHIVTMDFGMCLIRVGDEQLPPESRRELRRLKSLIDHEFRRLVAAGVEEGSIAPCDPKMTAFVIAGALSWIGRWYQPEGEYTPEQVAEQCIATLCAGVLQRPAPK